MKILIVGIGRSGTTSLLRGIATQGYHSISEPYNEWIRKELSYPLLELNQHSNIVVKTTSYQKPKKYKDSWIKFVQEFSKSFDKIIFLDRYNFDEHYESTINLWYKSHVQKQPVMSSWSSEDIPNLFRIGFLLGGGSHRLQKEKDEFKELVDNLNGTITWYEDLYGDDRITSLNIIKSWNIDIDSDELNRYLNPKYKLKKDKKNIF